MSLMFQAFPSSISAPKKPKNLHAMDCTDMVRQAFLNIYLKFPILEKISWSNQIIAQVVGSAKEGRGRVGDFYTRDRSTPLPDQFYVSNLLRCCCCCCCQCQRQVHPSRALALFLFCCYSKLITNGFACF